MSCESLSRGMNYLEKQNPMATPTKDETCESNDPDRFLGLSPETAELWKTLGDTPDSKALKEEYLRTKGIFEWELRWKHYIRDDTGSPRMKQEQAALEKYMNEQMSKLRGQMQQELVQHQQALDEARKQHEAALQAEQERQEQLMMQRQAEHEATLQEEREQHEHNLCLLIEQASSAQAEAVRSMQTAPKPAKADTAPKPDANRADAHDAKAKLRAKMAIAVATTPQAAPAAQLALAVPALRKGLVLAKLNCLITFRTKTVKWRKNLQGYSWKTEAEMRKPPLEWEESRIQGAIKHCEKKKDLYDPNIRKYLVLVRDDVESAEEKLQELQQEMAQMGLLSSDFELGDIMEELDGETTTDNSKPQPGGKKRLAEYPTVEGEESIQEYLGQYRRAVLTRKALLKGARERLEKEGSKGHELLASTVCTVVCGPNLSKMLPCVLNCGCREDLKVLSTSGGASHSNGKHVPLRCIR
ncbi:unnamed protein product [Symbiodinium sp. CCMP2592]|nr:unnamed protein product [Symbiodinium sp. CCMP2592]